MHACRVGSRQGGGGVGHAPAWANKQTSTACSAPHPAPLGFVPGKGDVLAFAPAQRLPSLHQTPSADRSFTRLSAGAAPTNNIRWRVMNLTCLSDSSQYRCPMRLLRKIVGLKPGASGAGHVSSVHCASSQRRSPRILQCKAEACQVAARTSWHCHEQHGAYLHPAPAEISVALPHGLMCPQRTVRRETPGLSALPAQR